MPEYIVVRCYSCRIHQAIQINKKGKFSCKLCGAAQSVKAVLASSTSSRDLREIVQDLNMKLQDEDLAREAIRQQEPARQEPRQQLPRERQPELQQQSEAVPASRWFQFCTEPSSSTVGASASAADTGGGHVSSAASSRWAQFCTETPGGNGSAATAEDGGSAREVDGGSFVTTFEDAAGRRNSGRAMHAALGRGRGKRPAWNSEAGEETGGPKRFRGRKYRGASDWASAPCDGKENRETAPAQLDKPAATHSTMLAASSRWARFMG
mmetsp:Transcript_29471/g.48209  ORF Transcript_29471/g.48209 Transcript_29471/m.48209 type:complete len:267 (+) Transcript_29471:120-920(+)